MFDFLSLSLTFLSGACLAWVALRWRGRLSDVDDDVFRLVAQGASDGLVLMEADSKIIWVNPAYCRIMGYPFEQLIGRYPLEFALPPEDALSPEEARAFRFDPDEERFGKLTRVRNIRSDGTHFMHEFSHAAIRTRDRTLFLLSSRDVSVAEEREAALIVARENVDLKARTDALTGLANRVEMHRALEALLAEPAPFVVMQLDMNKFKEVNDTYGHNAGDALLCHFADTLNDHADPEWVAARTGGDEFVILAPNLTTLDDAIDCASFLAEVAGAPMKWKAGTLVAHIAIGVALRDNTDVSADELLNASDVALYAAKQRSDGSIAAYDADLHASYMREQELHQDLSKAFENQQISFHFQPIVDAQRNRVVKFEMLARWLHPEKGLISPAVFMPAVQYLGMMQRLDELVVDTAIDALRILSAANLEHTGVSINISDEGLFGDMPNLMIWTIDAEQLDPARVSIEVLETTAISLTEDDTAIARLAELGEAGFRIFLDDFGMGYAGLAHLAGLDVDGIKIDRGLVNAIETNTTSASIVSALIKLCNELGLDVIAEGVETFEQMSMINSIGSTIFQGYLFAKPMPLGEAINWAHEFEAQAIEAAG